MVNVVIPIVQWLILLPMVRSRGYTVVWEYQGTMMMMKPSRQKQNTIKSYETNTIYGNKRNGNNDKGGSSHERHVLLRTEKQ